MSEFFLDVSYAQISIFDSALASPFNDWTDEHVHQGFSWRAGSVSFATLDASGKVRVDVTRADVADWRASVADRIIAVPFAVPTHGNVEISTITGSMALQLDPGEYELTFEHGRDMAGTMWATFHLSPAETLVEARVIRADSALSPPTELIMTAQPA